MSLQVSRFQERTEVLGPGTRAVIWFRGCSLRCPGCMAEAMNNDETHEAWTPQALADRVCRLHGIEGITLSGGDPFDQPLESLTAFTEAVRHNSNLSIMAFTGRTLPQLQRQIPSTLRERLLANFDVLVDGPYVEELNDGSLWRGSSNQTIHFLTPRYAYLRPHVETSHNRGLEVSIRNGREVEFTGIPPKGFLDSLTGRLAKQGLRLDFTALTQNNEV